MEKIIIQEPLRNSPAIFYFPEENILEISGRSIPENPDKIFIRLNEWIRGFLEENSSLIVNIQLEYINSGSAKYLYETLKKLTAYGHIGKTIKIKWFYEEDDEAMLELGEHYRDTAGILLEISMIL
jgi:hypothetical protein